MPTHTTRLLIHGASGRMGQSLLRLCREEPVPGCTVVAAISRRVAQRVVDGIPQFTAAEMAGVPPYDVAIDFSLPEGVAAIAALCAARGAGLVSGTTGLGDGERGALEALSGVAPVMWASNFSIGVAVLADLVARAAPALQGWDCDIVEQHHVHKRDAPSGTALSLGAAAGSGGAMARYASLRAGDIVGEHTVQFAAAGERIELVHRATSRDVFGRGALVAATRLHGRTPGMYALRDLLFDRA